MVYQIYKMIILHWIEHHIHSASAPVGGIVVREVHQNGAHFTEVDAGLATETRRRFVDVIVSKDVKNAQNAASHARITFFINGIVQVYGALDEAVPFG